MCRCIFGWQNVTYHFRVTLALTSDLVYRIIVSRTYLLYYLRWESLIGVWVHIVMVECRVPCTAHCGLKFDLLPRFLNIYIWSISLLLFEVEILNSVCECILELRIIQFHFPVTVTLTSDLVSRFSIPPIFFEVGISNYVCGCILEWSSAAYHLWVIVTSTSDLIFWNNHVWSIFFYIILARNPKFGVLLHLGMAECHVSI